MRLGHRLLVGFGAVGYAVAFASLNPPPPSFEELARLAPVVVVGRVTHSPEFGVEKSFSGGTTVVIREHSFQVAEYIKGSGPPEIAIQTLGGKFKSPGSSDVLYRVSGGQPQLPEDGSELLLFLTPFGGDDKYMIAAAQAAIVNVLREGDGSRVVELSFTDPAVMPTDVLNGLRTAEPSVLPTAVTAKVPTSSLRELVAKACAPKPRPLPPN